MVARLLKKVKVTLGNGDTITGWAADDNTDYCRIIYFTEEGGGMENGVYIEAPGAKFEDVFELPTKPFALVIPQYVNEHQADPGFVPFALGRDGEWYEVGSGDQWGAESLLDTWDDGHTKLVILYEGRDE